MSKMIQIRNVPDGLHRQLKIRAAAAGRTLSDYLLDELGRFASRPTFEELRRRIAARGPTVLEKSAADAVRLGREERERDFDP